VVAAPGILCGRSTTAPAASHVYEGSTLC
jgi:hypothetical protein